MMFVLSGCNDSKPAGDDGKIGFASQMTRALINNAEDLQQQELRLCGAYTLYGRTARVFDSERLYYNAEIQAWDYDIPQYWIMNASYRFACSGTFFDNVFFFKIAAAYNDGGVIFAVEPRDVFSFFYTNYYFTCFFWKTFEKP